MQQMTPGKLDHPTTHARIACFGKSSLASFLAALVRCPCQTSVPRHRSAVPQLARKNLPHQPLALTARPFRILILERGDRSHAAVIRLTAQPAEKGALEQLGIETIRLCSPVLT